MMIVNDYQLLDSGDGRKLERFGDFVLNRPASQAVWRKTLPDDIWSNAHVIVDRDGKKTLLQRSKIPSTWSTTIEGIVFKLSVTDFGHIGVFPEQRSNWERLQDLVAHRIQHDSAPNILNLFAYSGGSTLACAKAGAKVTHLDASKGMVSWARENADLNGLSEAPIRWIVDDVIKFCERELRRGSTYDGIILDPPTYGRGKANEVFKIEEHLPYLLELCASLLTKTPLFILLSCHTPGFSPTVLQHLLQQSLHLNGGTYEPGEMLLEGGHDAVFDLPNGTQCFWIAEF
jgi:23S rRNA (cytosine1962-C5)-methyltransferase